MMNLNNIDITYDVRTDSHGKDPDSASATLKAYHQLLWSKPLPNGQAMELTTQNSSYLRWNDMYFGSDSIIVSFMNGRYKHRQYIENSIPNFKEYREDYLKRSYTIAGSIIFPKHIRSMNQERGCNRKISDRWDLTLECIRRFYAGESSPLDNVLGIDAEFYNLFVDFKGYVDFFLLQDCVDEDYNVKFWLDTPLWVSDPVPETVAAYKDWIEKELNFVEKRGKRILEYCKTKTNNAI